MIQRRKRRKGYALSRTGSPSAIFLSLLLRSRCPFVSHLTGRLFRFGGDDDDDGGATGSASGGGDFCANHFLGAFPPRQRAGLCNSVGDGDDGTGDDGGEGGNGGGMHFCASCFGYIFLGVGTSRTLQREGELFSKFNAMPRHSAAFVPCWVCIDT